MPLVIVGGGLAGGLAALALARRRPEVPLLLLEAGESFGGNHLWSFFDADIPGRDRWLVTPLVSARWPDYEVRFPAHRRRLPGPYNSIRSDRLDAALRAALPPRRYRLGARIAALDARSVTLADGERIAARAVIDARGAGDLSVLDLGWQKFVGHDLLFERPHGLSRPIVMDAAVDQSEGYRFVYCLPFDDRRMLVEDTYYSLSPALDPQALDARIADYVAARGWPAARVERIESGVLPVAMGGDFDLFWPDAPGTPARIGLAGGFFHPTTGYTLPDAVRTAAWLAGRAPMEGEALRAATRARAARLWTDRHFYRLLDRMLLRAADPPERYRVLQRFYRLDPGLIARFYAGRAHLLDKARILAGRPPVPIGRALKALRGEAA